MFCCRQLRLSSVKLAYATAGLRYKRGSNKSFHSISTTYSRSFIRALFRFQERIISAPTPIKATHDITTTGRLLELEADDIESASNTSPDLHSTPVSIDHPGANLLLPTSANYLSIIPSTMASTGNTGRTSQIFHLFNNLPVELRFRIWNLTVEPRLVNLMIGETAAIAALQASKESRKEHGKTFETLSCEELDEQSMEDIITRPESEEDV